MGDFSGRYENERLIINTHIDNIMKLPSLTSENAGQLRQIQQRMHDIPVMRCWIVALNLISLRNHQLED
jgi:hypothetical protein